MPEFPFSTPLQEGEFEPEFAKAMLEVFKRVCHALKVTDPADPLSATIARAVILLAQEGERDPEILFKQTLGKFVS